MLLGVAGTPARVRHQKKWEAGYGRDASQPLTVRSNRIDLEGLEAGSIISVIGEGYNWAIAGENSFQPLVREG